MQIGNENLSLLAIIDSLPIHIYWKDSNGILLGCNQKTLASFGCASDDDYIGKTDYDLFPKEQADELRRVDDEVMRTGRPIVVEEFVNVASGKGALFLSVKVPLRDEEEKICGTAGMAVDITAIRKINLNELHILNSIIALIPGHVYWKDALGNYLGCNNEQALALGLKSRQEIKNKIPYSDLPASEAARLIKNDKTVLEQEKTLTVEEPGVRENGEQGIFLTKKAPLYDSDEKIVGLLGVSFDITERKLVEEQLKTAKTLAEEASNTKTEFIQNMQHDIRTPSAGLWGVLDALAKAETDSNKREALDMAVNASKRLLDLCNDAVEFGNLGGNGRPPLEKALDIRQLAKSVIELNLPAAFAKDLLFHFNVDTSVPIHVMSDEFRISRILINLLGNAIKFTNKGEVSLKIKAKMGEKTRHGLLTIEVKDTGIGISANKIQNIYEKFTRAVASNTNKYPGTGLGLYVVKTFIEELDGDIEVESHENEGSHFKLTIPFKVLWEDLNKPGEKIDQHFDSPLNKKTTHESNSKQKVEKTSQTKTPFAHEVLLIEDDKTCLFGEKRLLTAFTNKIDSAENVAEALEKLALKRYDLVISDLGLPDGSGCDIVAQIKASSGSLNHETPFVAMTAHRDEQKLRQAMNAGFSATHTKPLTTETAVELLNIYSVPGTEQNKHEGLAVIDLALGMQRISVQDEGPAIEALSILLKTLQEDIPALQEAEKNNDIVKAREVLHKIRGGLYYSGTPRLEESFKVLHDEVKRTPNLKKIDLLFSLAYDEVKLFAEEYHELVQN